MDTMFVSAVASARTARIADGEKLRRMADAATTSEAYRVLQETGFGGDAKTFDAAIRNEDAALAAFVRDYAPNRNLAASLLAEYDFHNAEALMKATRLNLSADALLRPAGLFEISFLKERIAKSEYADFPRELRAACEAADAAFVAGTDGMTVGSIFARAKTAYLFRVTENSVLKRLLIYRTDATNLEICYRAKNFALAEKMLLSGGKIGASALRKVCEATDDAIIAEFRMSDYAGLVAVMSEASSAGQPFVAAERMIAEHEVSELRRRRFELGGVLPFVLYTAYKRAEIDNVRIVAAGIENGLDRTEIRERMRACYEG